MKHPIRIFGRVLLCSILFGIVFTSAATAQQLSFDGKIYSVTVEIENEEGEIETWSDEIQFQAGKVTSGFSKKNGFADAAYTVEAEDTDGLTTYYFSATAVSSTGETLTWTIAITEGFISGEASGTNATYIFDGKLN